MLIRITNEAVLNYWGKPVQAVVSLHEERLDHIAHNHADDYAAYSPYIVDAILDPLLVLQDNKNELTALFIGRTPFNGINVAVKLALEEDRTDRSFVVTMHPIGKKRLRRLRKHSQVIFDSGYDEEDDDLKQDSKG